MQDKEEQTYSRNSASTDISWTLKEVLGRNMVLL